MNNISLIVLTYNESLHIKRCLESVDGLVDEIIIIDSNSNDDTINISKKFKARIYKNKWPGTQAKQLEWFFNNHKVSNKWILRLDADEYLLPKLKEEIKKSIRNNEPNISGYYINRRLVFMDSWIKYGGYYPMYILRIWKNGYGYWEQKNMDEHFVITKGKTKKLKNDFVDHNLNDLSWWTDKHNNYSNREVNDFFMNQKSYNRFDGILYVKRFFKENIYYNLPSFLRSSLYFLLRYFILLGFLDGKKGFIWHFLQAFWYRSLIDFKIYERKIRKKN